MPSIEELRPLITQPREELSVEHKGWLDLSINEDRAKLAKAAIALANHGGGYIVIGFTETGQSLESRPNTPKTPPITQDLVNQAINRFAEPVFQCGVYNLPHPDTNVSHPVITVPGDQSVPVMSRRRCGNVIEQNRCYTRKPGPKSEEPQTSEEWRTLLNRCVRANRDDMLDAIRGIVTGSVNEPVRNPRAHEELLNYSSVARDRWQELVSVEPESSPARFQHGYYEMAFSLLDAVATKDLTELRTRLSDAGKINMSGWPPFLILPAPDWAPYVHGDFIEAWLGRPSQNGWYQNKSDQCDFWRASRDGELYTIRGYAEDVDNDAPGRMLYTTTMIWRIGDGLMFADRLARTFEEVDQICVFCRFTGLDNRRIRTAPWRQGLPSAPPNHTCRTDEVVIEDQFTLQQVEDNLAEILHSFLQRLYERFSFFELPFDVVADELNKMRSYRS